MKICTNGIEAGRNWLESGYIKVIAQKQLSELKVGDHFIYKKQFCTILVASKWYVSYENAIRQQACTTRTDMLVAQVEFTDKVKEKM